MNKIHNLKILSSYYTDVDLGLKKAELRKDDRDFEVGDYIQFTVIYPDSYEERTICRLYIITHILRSVPEYGLVPGYCILSIEKSKPFRW